MAEQVAVLSSDSVFDELTRPKSFWYKAFHQIIRNNRAILGFIVLLVLVLAAVFAEQIAPYNPYKTNYSNVKQPPSVEHFIGTDELGRDGFSRLILRRAHFPAGGRIRLRHIHDRRRRPWGNRGVFRRRGRHDHHARCRPIHGIPFSRPPPSPWSRSLVPACST